MVTELIKLITGHGLHISRMKALLKFQPHIVDLPDTAKGFIYEVLLVFVWINPILDSTVDDDGFHEDLLSIST